MDKRRRKMLSLESQKKGRISIRQKDQTLSREVSFMGTLFLKRSGNIKAVQGFHLLRGDINQLLVLNLRREIKDLLVLQEEESLVKQEKKKSKFFLIPAQHFKENYFCNLFLSILV